jgi:hypothetical protein
MSYATVMVSLTVDQSNEAVLEVAAQLAEKFDARVIGIAAAVLSPPPYFMAGDGVGPRRARQSHSERRALSQSRTVVASAVIAATASVIH